MDYFVDNLLIQSTFFLKIGNTTGTCFALTKSNVQYLITAAHCVKGHKHLEEIEIELFHDETWKKVRGALHLHKNANIDIAVVKLSSFIAPVFEIDIHARVLLGQDVFFLGFPYGLHSGNDLDRNFPIPFIKKAVFSAAVNDPITGIIQFLDGHNNKGFSGGPVGYYDIKQQKTFIVGVISGYIPQQGEIDTPIGKLFYNENSGIILTYSIKHADEIINEIK